MIYFTSDLHLGHRAIISMQNRPFADVVEMDRTLIDNYNAMVHKDDTVYILGDIAHHMHVEDVNKIIEKLNGRKILIRDFLRIGRPGKSRSEAFSIIRRSSLKIISQQPV